MKRSDIIRTIQVQFKHMRIKDATAMLDTVVDGIQKAIADGKKIEIRGFGTFQARQHSAKTGYNPQNGGVINIPAKKVVLFKPSKELTKDMNGK